MTRLPIAATALTFATLAAAAAGAQELSFRISLEPAEGEAVERIIEIERDQVTVAQVDEENPVYEERAVEEADRTAIRELLRARVADMDFAAGTPAEPPRYTVEIDWDGDGRQVQVEEVHAEGELPQDLVTVQERFYEEALR